MFLGLVPYNLEIAAHIAHKKSESNRIFFPQTSVTVEHPGNCGLKSVRANTSAFTSEVHSLLFQQLESPNSRELIMQDTLFIIKQSVC